MVDPVLVYAKDMSLVTHVISVLKSCDLNVTECTTIDALISAARPLVDPPVMLLHHATLEDLEKINAAVVPYLVQVCDDIIEDQLRSNTLTQNSSGYHGLIATKPTPLQARLIIQLHGKDSASPSGSFLIEDAGTPRVFTIKTLRERYLMLDEIEEELGQLDVQPFVNSCVTDFLLELVSNAIFDAPVDDQGNKKYHIKKMTLDTEFEERDHILVKTVVTDNEIIVSVRDRYGLLEKSDYFSILAKCFTRNTDRVETEDETGGGGIGFFRMYAAMSAMVFNVIENDSTEVIGVIERRIRRRNHRFYPRSVFFNLKMV